MQRLEAQLHETPTPHTVLTMAQEQVESAPPAAPQKQATPPPVLLTGANVSLFNASKIPILRLPSLAPTVLEVLKLENVRGDMPQNLTNPKPLKLSELMPKLPTIPSFSAPVFTPETTDAEYVSNVTAAAKALMTPLVESTMLPSYIGGLKSRIVDEIGWLKSFANDTTRQTVMCGIFAQQMGSCVAFTAKMQSTKIQALQSGLKVLLQIEAQLNTDIAQKLSAFNVVSRGCGGGRQSVVIDCGGPYIYADIFVRRPSLTRLLHPPSLSKPTQPQTQPSQGALGGNWMCEVGADLDQAILKAAALKSASNAYAAKTKNAVEKLNDFLQGQWSTSPWWHMEEGTELPKLAVPCPIVQALPQ